MRIVLCHGTSMWPFLRPGDRVAVEPVDPSTLRRGQIAVFRGDDGEEIIHRVVSTKGCIVTRGDNAGRSDGIVEPGRLIGLVVGRYAAKRLVRFTRARELFGLGCARPARMLRVAARGVLSVVAPLAYPLLPMRTVVFSEGDGTRAAVFLFRRTIASRHGSPSGERVWIHPVFRRTGLLRRLRAVALRA
ncbi:MAG: hypothetical protein GF331_02225 [Chitinivibrionales bacterium]|nr:hypothetical protein [Chitinivibrionales bacterium]